jgi:hypothetical protein
MDLSSKILKEKGNKTDTFAGAGVFLMGLSFFENTLNDLIPTAPPTQPPRLAIVSATSTLQSF